MAITPPHSEDAEQSILGCLLLENEAFDLVEGLDSNDFYFIEHQIIYLAISDLIGENKPADVVTISNHLQARHKLNQAGGIAYLNKLTEYVSSTAHIEQYVEIVRDTATLRALAQSGQEITRAAFHTNGRSVSEIVDSAEQKIFKIGEQGSRHKQSFHPMDKLVANLFDHVDRNMSRDNTNAVIGTPTGFDKLDEMTCGLNSGDLIVLAARPSMGKTSLGMNIAEHIAFIKNKPVAVFSMEMNADQLMLRIASSMGRIDHTHLRTGQLSNNECERLVECADYFSKSKLHIDDNAAHTVASIRSSTRRLARQHNGQIGLILVDYLQLMSSTSTRNGDTRSSDLGEMSRGLKNLAREMQCPVIALSQLNRSVEQRQDKRPLLSDLRESGALEQDADIVLFIYRDEYYTKEACKAPGIAEVIVAKQRNGPTGTVKLSFLSNITKFESI